MRIILSRKGFDTQYGGQPSPILPNGNLLSLPIPAKNEKVKFEDLNYCGKSYLQIINELKPNSKIKNSWTCHLDPDIRKEITFRQGDWVPLFGQTGSAQGHLLKNKVEKGDLFLFFGWFKETEYIDNVLKYKKDAPDLHVIYGYLQIGEIYSDFSTFPNELHNHAHAQKRFESDKNNTIYKATEQLDFLPFVAGAGCFKYHPDLVLTKSGFSKSKWELPDFYITLNITYHNKDSFIENYFQSAAKGQEFIVEKNYLVDEWAKKITKNGLRL